VDLDLIVVIVDGELEREELLMTTRKRRDQKFLNVRFEK
jgi:hypothetical protein